VAFAEDLEGEVLTLDYQPRWYFVPYHERKQRWACIVAHRRAGKTLATFRDLERAALADRRPDPLYAFIAPTYRQAKDNVWKYVERAGGEWRGAKINQSELSVRYPHGATIKLYGADNYDTLRGLRLCGAILDEFADFDPRAWPTVIRPALADRRGAATIIGTPRGHNSFYQIFQNSLGYTDDGQFNPALKDEWYSLVLKASDLVPVNDKDPRAYEKDLLTSDELESIKRGQSEEEYKQEFECDFESAVLGAYYGKPMAEAEKDGRITAAPYDPAHQVWTAWDLGGNRDATAIWFAQIIGRQVVLIDYYEAIGADSGPHARAVLNKPYSYAQHFIPHDAGPSRTGIDKSYLDFLSDHGLKNITVLPVQMVEHGINAVRLLLPRCLFDRKNCYTGIEALKLYRAEYDYKHAYLKPTPVHDWTSHAADAFRYLAIALDRHVSRTSFNRKIIYPKTGKL
jgi:phage terminase large subunit